jgi:hypothetical protein
MPQSLDVSISSPTHVSLVGRGCVSRLLSAHDIHHMMSSISSSRPYIDLVVPVDDRLAMLLTVSFFTLDLINIFQPKSSRSDLSLSDFFNSAAAAIPQTRMQSLIYIHYVPFMCIEEVEDFVFPLLTARTSWLTTFLRSTNPLPLHDHRHVT